MGIVKVLTDDSEEDYEPRRTPRRVRFGGEIVKLRTPDSDSNQPSDLDNDSTITITPRESGSDKPVIEIHYTDKKTQRSKSVSKSSIPVPNAKKEKVVQSEPSSPARSDSKVKRKFRSSPNLSKMQNVFGEKVPNGGSRIPRRNSEKDKKVEKEKESSRTTTIEIRLTDFRSKSKSKSSDSKSAKQAKKKTEEATGKKSKSKQKEETSEKKPETKEEAPTKKAETKEKESVKKIETKEPKKEETSKQETKPKPPPLKIPKPKGETHQKNKIAEDLSPAPVHKQIEIFHNLTRSPERKNVDPFKFPENAAGDDQNKKELTSDVKNEVQDKKDSSKEIKDAKNTSEPQQTAPKAEPEKTSESPPKTIEDRHLTTADKVLLNREVKPVRCRNVHTADQTNKGTVNQNGVIPGASNAYNSFHVCSSTFSEAFKLRNYIDSPIPTNDNGDCLTCSSSGSDTLIFDSSWEDVGVVDKIVISNLNCKVSNFKIFILL